MSLTIAGNAHRSAAVVEIDLKTVSYGNRKFSEQRTILSAQVLKGRRSDTPWIELIRTCAGVVDQYSKGFHTTEFAIVLTLCCDHRRFDGALHLPS